MWVPVTASRTCMLPLHTFALEVFAVRAATAVPVIVRLWLGAVVVVVGDGELPFAVEWADGFRPGPVVALGLRTTPARWTRAVPVATGRVAR